MAKRKYPYSAFIVTPSMAVKEVTLVESAYSWSSSTWDKTESGKAYLLSSLHKTRDAAIEAGEAKLAKQIANLEKQKQTVAKRRANLDKAIGIAA